MKQVNSRSVDMIHGPMLKKILLFAIPIAAGSILQQLFNAVDVAVVGRFASSDALAAVGANTAVVALFINLFVGISVGSNVVIAQMIGSGKKERVSDAVHTSVLLALIGGTALLIFGFIMAEKILTLMSTPENIMVMSVLYLRIYCMGMPFIMLYNFIAAILRSVGDSKRPLYCLVTAGIVNACLNMLLVIVFHMSVAGVAIATVISTVVSSMMALNFLRHSDDMFHVQLKRLRIKKDVLIPILKIGIPSGIQGVVFSVSNVCIQSSINSFGSSAVAGSSIETNFEYISYFAVNGFNSAVMTFVGQNLGAGKLKRCLRAYLICLICGGIASAVFNTSFYLARGVLVSIFTTDPEVMEYTFLRMRYVLLFYAIIIIYESTGAAMRGLGRAFLPSLITIFGTCLFRLLYINTAVPANHVFTTLLMVYPLSWIITGTATIVAFIILWRRITRKNPY